MLKITRIIKRFLRSITDGVFLRIIHFFSEHIMMKSSTLEEDKNVEHNIIKG